MKFAHLADLHLGMIVNHVSMAEEQKHILKEIVEILITFVAAILGANWVIKKNTQRISQKQKSGKNSVNISIINNNGKEK